ncbi:MAG: NADH-quinone oxidoreductase subunit NuoK [Terracoccus sp.]
MMHLQYPLALAALLAGIGIFGVLARRNAVLVLIGVELILNAANLILVTVGSQPRAPFAAGPVLTLFVITIAAAEVCVALAVILAMFRGLGHIDLTANPELAGDPADDPADDPEPADDDPAGSNYAVATGDHDSPRTEIAS